MHAFNREFDPPSPWKGEPSGTHHTPSTLPYSHSWLHSGGHLTWLGQSDIPSQEPETGILGTWVRWHEAPELPGQAVCGPGVSRVSQSWKLRGGRGCRGKVRRESWSEEVTYQQSRTSVHSVLEEMGGGARITLPAHATWLYFISYLSLDVWCLWSCPLCPFNKLLNWNKYEWVSVPYRQNTLALY